MGISLQQAVQFAYNAGFRNGPTTEALSIIVAISLCECGSQACGCNPDVLPNISCGVLQIAQQYHPGTAACAVDPACCYRLGYGISGHGTSFTAWTTYRNGCFRAHLDAVRAAIAGMGPPIGPGPPGPPDPHPECTNEGAHWVIPGLSGQPGGSCSCNETTPCWSGQDSTRGIPGTGPCVALPPGHVVRRFQSGNPTGDCPTPGELSPDGSGETWFLLLLAAAAAGGYALHRGHHLPHALRREEDWIRSEAGRAERWVQRRARTGSQPRIGWSMA